MSENTQGPASFTQTDDNTRRFTDIKEALDYATQILLTNKAFIRRGFSEALNGQVPEQPVIAHYPYIRVKISDVSRQTLRRNTDPSGHVHTAGTYSTTVARLDVMQDKVAHQLELMRKAHGDFEIEIGVSPQAIPYELAFNDGMSMGDGQILDANLRDVLDSAFTPLDLANTSFEPKRASDGGVYEGDFALAPYDALTTDYGMARLYYYTGVRAADIQDHVLFTNYATYMDMFASAATDVLRRRMSDEGQRLPRDIVYLSGSGGLMVHQADAGLSDASASRRMPQFPTLNAVMPDGSGVSMINIGVGPSNANTITQYLAVLRSSAWLTVGHVAGFHATQQVGDKVAAIGFVRLDGVAEDFLPPEVQIPPSGELLSMAEAACAEVTGTTGEALRQSLRKGLMVTVANRLWYENWLGGKLRPTQAARMKAAILDQSKPVALDMESGVIAAAGFYHRVPTLFLGIVSDRPGYFEHKLPGLVDEFYNRSVKEHLSIALRTMEMARVANGRLHSRSLRSTDEPPFR